MYARRTFYIDEDSWQVLAVDCYDGRGSLWRFQEGFAINYYDQPNLWTTAETIYDLQSGRYLAIGVDSEETIVFGFNDPMALTQFSLTSLRKLGRDGTNKSDPPPPPPPPPPPWTKPRPHDWGHEGGGMTNVHINGLVAAEHLGGWLQLGAELGWDNKLQGKGKNG